ncbi:MAG TPA: TPM domain-containing protein [Opitutaceae bacterium]
MRLWTTALAAFAAAAAWAGAAEVIPRPPPEYFNDYASVVSAPTADALNSRLEQFERATSNQILVAIYPEMQSDSSVEDYTVRVAQSWRVGTKLEKNGAVLFVFIKSHKMYLQVGYGLEGAIPDALAKRIISDVIAPRFRAGDYDGGMTKGVDAILAAAKGEYRGTGSTVAEGQSRDDSWMIAGGLFVLFFLISTLRSRASVYGSRGRRGIGGYIPTIFPGGGWGGGGGGGGFGGGGFSGGGGSFGGGGAGGSW